MRNNIHNKFIFGIFLILLLTSVFVYAIEDSTASENTITGMVEGKNPEDISSVVIDDYDSEKADRNIEANNIDYEKKDGITRFTFREQGSQLNMDRKYFIEGSDKIDHHENTNIANVVSKEGAESYLEMDSKGEIKSAVLHIGQDSNVEGNLYRMDISGMRVIAPVGSTVLIENGEVTILNPEKNEEVKGSSKLEFRKTKEGDLSGALSKGVYKGKFVINPLSSYDTNIEIDGVLRYDENGYYMERGDTVNVAGTMVRANERINIDFQRTKDGKVSFGEAPSVVFLEQGYPYGFSCAENPNVVEIEFSDTKNTAGYDLELTRSKLFAEGMSEKKLANDVEWIREKNRAEYGGALTVGLTEPNSSILFNRKIWNEGMDIGRQGTPSMIASNGYKISSGRVGLLAKNGRVEYYRNYNEDLDSREFIVYDNSNEKYDRLIQVGENSNIAMSTKVKGSDWEDSQTKEQRKEANLYYFKDNIENFGTYEFEGNKALQEDFIKKRKYIEEAQAILNKELIKKNPEISNYINEYSGNIPMWKVDELVNKGVRVENVISPAERRSILKKAGYEEFDSVADSLMDMFPYVDTSGAKEKARPISEQYYGARLAFMKFSLGENQEEYMKNFRTAKAYNPDYSKVYWADKGKDEKPIVTE